MPNFPISNIKSDGGLVMLPVKPHNWSNGGKLHRAQILSNWVTKQMDASGAETAVLSRCGFFLTVLFDQTCMAHSGMIFRHPDTREWIVYNLYSDPATNLRTSRLWQQSLVDFFYTADSNQLDAMLLLPNEDLQHSLLERLHEVPVKSLLPDDEHFNLIAPIPDLKSFNCTKWILVNLFAASHQIDDLPTLLKLIEKEHVIPTIKAGPLTRLVLSQLRDTHLEEHYPPSRIRTTTVGSLYASPMFTQKIFYSDRKITQDPNLPATKIVI